MANAGFNAATDLFSMGSAWKVKSSNLNKSASTGECPNDKGDITHRDTYGEKIAPTAEYELETDVIALPDLGTIVTFDSVKVAINNITVKTAKGQPVSATVSGVQVEAGATTRRTYSCGTLAISARHRAQDILGLLGSTVPTTLTEASVTFSADVTISEPQGDIEGNDVSNGKAVASFTHTIGDGTAITAPTVTGADKVVSQPATKTSPENDYVTTEYGITYSLTGSEPTNG